MTDKINPVCPKHFSRKRANRFKHGIADCFGESTAKSPTELAICL